MNGDLLKATAPAQTARSGWTTGRIIALATGSVLALFSLVLMAGCAALTWADQALARRILALQLPPAGAIAAEAAVVLAAIAALTLWRRFGPGHRDQGLANSGLTTPSAHDAAQL